MAVTPSEILDLFSQVGAIKNSDQFLIAKTNTNGTVTTAKVTAEVLRAYLNAGFEITIGDDGLIYIGGVPTTVNVTAQIVVEQTETVISISPNRLNKWGRVNSLTIGFEGALTGKVNEYMMEFIVGSSNFSLSLPEGIRWIDGEQPDWELGFTYQVSILNGLAIGAGWEAAANESVS